MRRNMLGTVRRTWLGTQPREQGAVTTIVAVLMTFGVVFGMLTVSVDIGQLLYERVQVQDGADASAFALATSCANVPCAANTSITSLNNANSYDGLNGVDQICYAVNHPAGAPTAYPSAPSGAITCGTATGTWADCSVLPDAVKTVDQLPYVEVRTRSKSAGGGWVKNWFAQLSGGPTHSSAGACARAGWGTASPTSDNVLNITMSECDWRQQTGFNGAAGSAVYPSAPQYASGGQGYYASPSNPGYGTASNPWPTANDWVYTKGNNTLCDTSAPGGTAPGGFAALTASSSCQTTLTTGPDRRLWAAGTPGNSLPCSDGQLRALLGTVINIPVFDCMTDSVVVVTSSTDCHSGNGSHNQYRISGFAAFYLTGWHLSSSSQTDIQTGSSPCPGGDRCLTGFFLHDIVQNAPITPPPSGSPSYGLLTVQPIG